MTTATYARPFLYEKQARAIFTEHRYGIIEASTKSGKTQGCLAWLLEEALTRGGPGRQFWWVSPTLSMARSQAFTRTQAGLRAGGFPMDLLGINDTRMTIRLPDGTVLWFRSGEEPDTLYGDDVMACVIDEASRQREAVFVAIRTTLTATRGRLRIIGNVKGKKNWAYRQARKAEAGEPDWSWARLTAADASTALIPRRLPDGRVHWRPVVDPEEIIDARRTLPAAAFQELYEAVAADDGTNPFGLEAILACVGPISGGMPAAWGVDLAKHVDWTVAHALDAEGRTCQWSRFQKPWTETTEVVRGLLGASVPALVDSTGVGDPIVEMLQRGPARSDAPRTNIEGYKFTQPSKQQLMEGLAVALQQREVSYPAGVIVNELESFEYEYRQGGIRYSAPEGSHDDCVMALALARHCLRGRPPRLRTW